MSSEGTTEDYGLQTSAVPAGLIVVWPTFPAINRPAIVNCSYGTNPGVPFHHLAVSPPDRPFRTSPTFNHTLVALVAMNRNKSTGVDTEEEEKAEAEQEQLRYLHIKVEPHQNDKSSSQ